MQDAPLVHGLKAQYAACDVEASLVLAEPGTPVRLGDKGQGNTNVQVSG